MKVSCLLLLLLSAKLALADADKTCCNKFTVSGLPNNNYNGEYSPSAGNNGLPSNQKGYYFESHRSTSGYTWQVWSSTPFYYTKDPTEVICAEDLGTFDMFDIMFGKRYEVTIKRDPSCPPLPTTVPPTTTAAPTSTSNPCPPCRNVVTGPMSGVYTHVGSGDDRCTYDGCLFKKDEELYCFQTGSDTVQEVCPP